MNNPFSFLLADCRLRKASK